MMIMTIRMIIMMTAMNTSDDNSNAKGDSITAMIIMSHFKMMKSDFRSGDIYYLRSRVAV